MGINNTNQQSAQILSELQSLSTEDKRTILPRFFKTGKGEYGEGDQFLGVTVPNIRIVAKCCLDIPMDTLAELIASEWHEMRMCGLMIMVENCKMMSKPSWKKNHSEDEGYILRKKYFDFYLKHTDKINNWDLVDLTAPTIIGEYLIDKPHDILYKLANSKLLWEQRIAVVSTYTFIRNNDFIDIYTIAKHLLKHPHDLMQKAIGWMLREAGKRNADQLRTFLNKHAKEMPRTMLRYSIEKFTETEKQYYMKK
jgi:3-methyladenine DNA glycosylase AlkD